MAYSITWEARGVVWTYRGVVTGAEILASNQAIYGDPRFDDLAYQIVDMRGVEHFDVTPDDMAVVAATDKAAAISNPGVRVAVVARSGVIKELSSFYEREILDSPWEQRIFEDVVAARDWAEAPREVV